MHHNGVSITSFRTCAKFKAWIERELNRHHIPREAILHVGMTVGFLVKDVEEIKVSGQVGFRSAMFSFDCRSEVKTDEKCYTSHSTGENRWGFD